MRNIVPVHNDLILIAIGGSTNVTELDQNVVLHVGFQIVSASLFHGSAAEEVIAATLTGPVVDDEIPINVELNQYQRVCLKHSNE